MLESGSRAPIQASTGWNGEPFSLWFYASALLRRWILVIALPLALCVWTGLTSLSSPRLYRASASFVPQEPTTTVSGLGQIASQFGLVAPRANTTSPQFYAGLLQSREILRAVVDTTYMATTPKPFKGDLVHYFAIQAPNRETAVAEAVERVGALLRVQTDRNTGVIRVELSTRYPELSAQLVSRLLGLVNDYNLLRRQSQARAEREFVEQRLTQVQAELTAAEDALATFSRRNRRFSDSPELVAEEQRLQRVVTLRQQVYVSLAQNYESAKIDEVRNTPVINVLERPEGFVEAAPRHTPRKVFVAFCVGLFAAAAFALGAEYLARAGQQASPDFETFVGLVGETVGRVRGGLFRRASKR